MSGGGGGGGQRLALPGWLAHLPTMHLQGSAECPGPPREAYLPIPWLIARLVVPGGNYFAWKGTEIVRQTRWFVKMAQRRKPAPGRTTAVPSRSLRRLAHPRKCMCFSLQSFAHRNPHSSLSQAQPSHMFRRAT